MAYMAPPVTRVASVAKEMACWHPLACPSLQHSTHARRMLVGHVTALSIQYIQAPCTPGASAGRPADRPTNNVPYSENYPCARGIASATPCICKVWQRQPTWGWPTASALPLPPCLHARSTSKKRRARPQRSIHVASIHSVIHSFVHKFISSIHSFGSCIRSCHMGYVCNALHPTAACAHTGIGSSCYPKNTQCRPQRPAGLAGHPWGCSPSRPTMLRPGAVPQGSDQQPLSSFPWPWRPICPYAKREKTRRLQGGELLRRLERWAYQTSSPACWHASLPSEHPSSRNSSNKLPPVAAQVANHGDDGHVALASAK